MRRGVPVYGTNHVILTARPPIKSPEKLKIRTLGVEADRYIARKVSETRYAPVVSLSAVSHAVTASRTPRRRR